jgi:NDP-sugar pyrophosphorylase family protein
MPVRQQSASAPSVHFSGDTFMSTQMAPKFGFATIGNGNHENFTAKAVEGSDNKFELIDNQLDKNVGTITVNNPNTSAIVSPYAGKDGNYVVIEANGVKGSVGAGGRLTMGGISINMGADETVEHADILDDASALAAAENNERPAHTQNHVKRMFLPASGVGTRLEPLLEQLDGETKPNVDLYPDTSILKELINHYSHFGIKEFILGVREERLPYFEKKILENLPEGVSVKFVTETGQSGTAGPLARVLNGEEGFTIPDDEPIMVGMGDAVLKSSFDVAEMIEAHKESGADVTIGVAQVPEHLIHKYGMVITEIPNESGFIESFAEKPKTDEAKAALGEHRLASTAIYVIEPSALKKLPEQYGRIRAGEIPEKDNGIDFATHLFEPKDELGLKLYAHKLDYSKWVDVGNRNTYKEVVNRIANGDVFGIKQTEALRKHMNASGALFLNTTEAEAKEANEDFEATGNVIVSKKAA